MRKYIFISWEGTTFLSGSEAIEPDVENLQVLGIEQGENAEQAFQKLMERTYVGEYEEIVSYEIGEREEHVV